MKITAAIEISSHINKSKEPKKMKFVSVVFSICFLIQLVTAPPPRRVEPQETQHEIPQDKSDFEDFGLEYNRYLREVIDLLESDPEFKKKLEDAQEVDIRSGKIAKELEFVDHKVRTKLDEVKRQEIERLRHLAQKQYELSHGIDVEHAKVSSEHLDHANPHTFEMEDLRKLIAKVSSDLSAADEKRRKEFKEYEMQKEFENQQKLKHLEGSEREAFEKQLKENETKHKQHERLHEPGSRQQLEEVWEKQDHMENQEFDPKVFFQLHDLDGNGFWDHTEVKALFLKELDKMYEAGAPEDDMKERVEEMERMREHVFKEADKNQDGLISYEEFLEKTKQPDFEKDPGWESLDQKPVYTREEYLEFEKRRQMEIQRMIEQGLIPAEPVFNNYPYHAQGHHPQYHPQVQPHPGGHPPQYQQPVYQHQQPAQPQYHAPPPPQPHGNQPVKVESQPSPHDQQQMKHSQGYQQQQQQQQPQQQAQQQGFQQRAYQPPHPNQQQQQAQQQNYPQPAYQQPQQGYQPSQSMHAPSGNANLHPGYRGDSPQSQHPNANYQNQSQSYQGRHESSNNVKLPPSQRELPKQQHQLDLKYSKSEGNENHPNLINAPLKSTENKT